MKYHIAEKPGRQNARVKGRVKFNPEPMALAICSRQTPRLIVVKRRRRTTKETQAKQPAPKPKPKAREPQEVPGNSCAAIVGNFGHLLQAWGFASRLLQDGGL